MGEFEVGAVWSGKAGRLLTASEVKKIEDWEKTCKKMIAKGKEPPAYPTFPKDPPKESVFKQETVLDARDCDVCGKLKGIGEIRLIAVTLNGKDYNDWYVCKRCRKKIKRGRTVEEIRKPHSNARSGGSSSRRRKSNSGGETRDRRCDDMSEKKSYEIDVGAKGTKQDARRGARQKARDEGLVFKVRSVKRHEKKKGTYIVSGDIKKRKISDKKGKKAKKDKKAAKKTSKKKATVKKKAEKPAEK